MCHVQFVPGHVRSVPGSVCVTSRLFREREREGASRASGPDAGCPRAASRGWQHGHVTSTLYQVKFVSRPVFTGSRPVCTGFSMCHVQVVQREREGAARASGPDAGRPRAASRRWQHGHLTSTLYQVKYVSRPVCTEFSVCHVQFVPGSICVSDGCRAPSGSCARLAKRYRLPTLRYKFW